MFSCFGTTLRWWHRKKWNLSLQSSSGTTIIPSDEQTPTGEEGSTPCLDVPHVPSTVAPFPCQGVSRLPCRVPIRHLRKHRIRFSVAWDIFVIENCHDEWCLLGAARESTAPISRSAHKIFGCDAIPCIWWYGLRQTERPWTIDTRKYLLTTGRLLNRTQTNQESLKYDGSVIIFLMIQWKRWTNLDKDVGRRWMGVESWISGW